MKELLTALTRKTEYGNCHQIDGLKRAARRAKVELIKQDQQLVAAKAEIAEYRRFMKDGESSRSVMARIAGGELVNGNACRMDSLDGRELIFIGGVNPNLVTYHDCVVYDVATRGLEMVKKSRLIKPLMPDQPAAK